MSQRSFLTAFARENLQTLNLRRFFGDYRTFAFDPDAFHLGIGEIANIIDEATWQRIFQDFDRDARLVSRATMYAGTRGEQSANQAMSDHVGGLLGRPELREHHVVPYDGGHNAVNGIIRACVALWVQHETPVSMSCCPRPVTPISRQSSMPTVG